MVDVLLTHSYHLYYDRKQTRRMQRYPPLGALYAPALPRSHGISVAVFDTMLNDPQEGFQAALEQHRPSIVVVYENNFNFLTKMWLTCMRKVAHEILEAFTTGWGYGSNKRFGRLRSCPGVLAARFPLRAVGRGGVDIAGTSSAVLARQ